jgi:hypothetical protein
MALAAGIRFVDFAQTAQSCFNAFDFKLGTWSATTRGLPPFSGRISASNTKGRFAMLIVEYWMFRDG